MTEEETTTTEGVEEITDDTIESTEEDTEENGDSNEDNNSDDDNEEDLEPQTRTSKKSDDAETPGDKKSDDVQAKGEEDTNARIARIENQTELNAFLVDKPEYKKYGPAILKHMNHPAYAQIPVEKIAVMLSAEDQQKIGARKEREATKKANDTKGNGTTVRKSNTGEVDWSKASPEEFAAQRAKVFGQG